MILELAVGDAYGAGLEYVNKVLVNKLNNLQSYHQHPNHPIGGGKYTDDTQMSLAIAELLVEGTEWTPLNLANKFVEVFKRDPRPGYAGGFYKFLQEVETGEEFLQKIRPESDKSGAAMRAGPLGFLPNIKKVIKYSTIQARITHDTPLGINAAVASALMPYYFINNLGTKENLGKFIENHVEGNWNMPWTGEVGEKGYMSVRAAITAIAEEDSLSKILKRSVDFGGDIDTVATIAMAAAACSSEIKQDLPKELIENLENGTYGRDYLIDLDNKLKRKFRKNE
ncbi:ADP-ribosylglycohydrolase family protein [archaeon]|jgi:ADP-ribosyl-[dinitrogen reductase] hydrolase|nr:ADP-ribosylglycohydrolase family protein [archaeon]MBT3577434.1 ADP-ribosylglycohydrolase family protein [archaeon]MBT6820323.1 ADP-ribosylglycohydrolase family protein [archaeon]MBT6956126.1 ADP-ribosylglycohydrolase family protein [archaeon]MBT7025137.1 ADP-ribosylglycohydrolase family protein [archaeon]